MKIYIKLLLMPLLAWSTYNYAETSAPILNQEMQHIDGHAIQAGRDVTINYQKSEDYQDLIRQRDSSLEDVQMYPENTKFAVQLAEVEKKIAAFERDVLQLAATIKSISRNSKRLEQATAYFEAGEFDKARVVLDIEEITKEQESLLQQKDALQKELETNADELILLAQATAINYELGEQRIPQTKAYFEQALVSDRSGDNLFRYAKFLQENNQFSLADRYYQEALKIYRALVKGNPSVYEPDLVTALGAYGLAHLNWNDNEKAAPLLKEASELLALLATQYPSIYGDKQAYILYLSAKAHLALGDFEHACSSAQQIIEVVQTLEDIKHKATETVGTCKELGVL